MGIVIGNAMSQTGQVVHGKHDVGSYADGTSISVPVLIAEGERPGPTVWVGACLHGDEFGGTVAIIRFFESLDPALLSGTVVGIPVSNPPAFIARSRVSPVDGVNLNRVFPGDTGSSYSSQLAAALSQAITSTADFLLDLHSGGLGAEVPFYAIYNDDGSEAAITSKKLAKQLGCKVLWRTQGEAGLGGTLSAIASQAGVPAVTVEVGGGGFSPHQLDDYTKAIRNSLVAMNMLSGESQTQDAYTIVSNGQFLFSRSGGLFVRECQVGEFLKENQPLGHIIDMHGNIVERIYSPMDDAFIAALRLQYFPIHAGEIVGEAVGVERIETVMD